MCEKKTRQSKKILFLAPYPEDEAASQRFRFEQYFYYLRQQGYSVLERSFYSYPIWKILYEKGFFLKKVMGLIAGYCRRIFHLFLCFRFDFIFIHRELSPAGPPVFEFIIARIWRKRIVYDFDDAIWIPKTSGVNAGIRAVKCSEKTSLICRWSTRVSCGNDFLKSYALKYNLNAHTIPTTLDTDRSHNRLKDQNSKRIIIGWTGTHSTLKYLDLILPVIAQLKNEIDFDFVVISDQKPDFGSVPYCFIPWEKDNEVEDILKINIGLMPLSDDEWSKGKCGFKALQFMALGIPPLVSPVGANKIIVDHGINGFHCSSNQEWISYSKKLIQDVSLRQKMGLKGREKVIRQYSTQANLPAFLDLFA